MEAILVLGSIFLVGVGLGLLDMRLSPATPYFRLTTFRYFREPDAW